MRLLHLQILVNTVKSAGQHFWNTEANLKYEQLDTLKYTDVSYVTITALLHQAEIWQLLPRLMRRSEHGISMLEVFVAIH